MGTILEFPADAASRRAGSNMASAPCEATIVILPVVRIERHVEGRSGDHGPGEGAAAGRRRKRRARTS